ncbi:Fe-S cluster assembly protein SufD [Lentilitoribacter sp. Alg239-R112]|uniref:Fe-S cluster assembly protein SufD n=1 Tax=Lentilitoribacter sp. Alg239-R112 TaxID=2305987 RepID=UPI0013A6C4A9|nr:Fe-S cluster assembly protein SufD [Lentilitoribacter sp. Alg239-R112]
MNIQSKLQKTAAEEALTSYFGDMVGQLSGSTHIVRMRDNNFAALLKNGLPTRRVEAWHYTDLRRLLSSVPVQQTDQSASVVAPFVAGSWVVGIRNGVTDAAMKVPEGVDISSLSSKLQSGEADAVFGELSADDAIGQLNSALVTDGYQIEIAADTHVDDLLELQFVQTGGQHHSKLPVVFKENSKATIIERHLSGDDAAALVSAVAHIKVEKGAHARWIIVQTQGADDTHLGQLNIELAENAELELYLINAGGKLVRQEIVANVEGAQTNLTLRGVNLLSGDTHTDVTLKLGHNTPNTTSSETFRNVLFDNAKGVFQGQIKVAQIAQKTDAQMACNTLLLSDDADFSAKPELEIFADDVICAHGATVTDIDPTHLFYLMARGISEKSARGLLVKGFVAEVVEEFDNEAVVDALEGVISDWLDANG